MKFASQIGDPAISTGYAALATEAATWIRSTGYDPVTQGLHYGRIMEACEPGNGSARRFQFQCADAWL